jgi:hypothetical protein
MLAGVLISGTSALGRGPGRDRRLVSWKDSV